MDDVSVVRNKDLRLWRGTKSKAGNAADGALVAKIVENSTK